MFGNNLRKMRRSKKLSMDRMIELYNAKYDAKMNKSTLSRYENGLQAPTGKTVKNIADFFNIPTDYLYSGHTEGNTQTIGEKIKERRTQIGLSQEELAKEIRYTSRSTIAKIEAGINDIAQSKIVAFANALKCTPTYLMGWESDNGLSLTPQEEELIIKYRNNPQMQEAVNKLLGI